MRIVKSFLLFFLLLLASCGKVVQESTQKKEDPAFRIIFSVPVVTKNVTTNDVALEKSFYVAVSAFETDGKKKELTWGQGKVDVKDIKVEGKPSIKTYVSKALTKKGIEITAADHTWTKAELKIVPGKSAEWSVECIELRRGSNGYLVSAFTDTSHYRLMWVNKNTVSGNATVDLKALEMYDTFLGVLRIMRIQDGDARLSYDNRFVEIFNPDFFNALHYVLPENKAPEFDPQRPFFLFDRLLEKTLLSIWDLYVVDPKEALGYLDEIKPEVLSPELKALLKKAIQETQSPKKT